MFGVQTSNTKYSQGLIYTLSLLGARTIAVTYADNNVFTRTTCEAALEYAATAANKYTVVYNETFNTGDGTTLLPMAYIFCTFPKIFIVCRQMSLIS